MPENPAVGHTVVGWKTAIFCGFLAQEALTMIGDPNAFPEILEEIARALEAPREADGSWQRDGRRRAHDRQAKLPRVFMARLVVRSDPSLIAELLVDLAVEHGVAKVEAKAELRCLYLARLEGQKSAVKNRQI